MRFGIYDELCKHRTPLDNTVWRFKEDEDKAFVDHIQFKNGQYLKCCKGDFEKTKEVAKRMNKIIKTSTSDPRMNYNTGNIYVVINGKAYIPETMEVRTGFRKQMEFGFTVTADPRYAAMNTMLAIKDVIFNPPATIVFWGDGSKTVVNCQDGEEYDPEKGLTMVFFKRMHDNKGHYFEEIKKWTKKYCEKYPTDSKGVSIEFTAHDWVEMIKKISDTSKLIAEMEKYRAEHDSDTK